MVHTPKALVGTVEQTGKLATNKLVQHRKAKSLKLVQAGKFTVFSDVQDSKAVDPIVVHNGASISSRSTL